MAWARAPATLPQTTQAAAQRSVAADAPLLEVMPVQLASYLEFFNAGFAGATGDSDQLATLAKALSVAYIEPDTSSENYLVDHSGQVVIVDPQGRYVGFIRPPLNTDQLAQWLPRIMAEE